MSKNMLIIESEFAKEKLIEKIKDAFTDDSSLIKKAFFPVWNYVAHINGESIIISKPMARFAAVFKGVVKERPKGSVIEGRFIFNSYMVFSLAAMAVMTAIVICGIVCGSHGFQMVKDDDVITLLGLAGLIIAWFFMYTIFYGNSKKKLIKLISICAGIEKTSD